MTTDTEAMPVLDTIVAMTAASLERCDLPADTTVLLRLAALAAVDARPASYLSNIGAALAVDITLEDAQNVLVAIAPIVGTARVTSAAINITEALGLAIQAFEDDDSE